MENNNYGIYALQMCNDFEKFCEDPKLKTGFICIDCDTKTNFMIFFTVLYAALLVMGVGFLLIGVGLVVGLPGTLLLFLRF